MTVKQRVVRQFVDATQGVVVVVPLRWSPRSNVWQCLRARRARSGAVSPDHGLCGRAPAARGCGLSAVRKANYINKFHVCPDLEAPWSTSGWLVTVPVRGRLSLNP